MRGQLCHGAYAVARDLDLIAVLSQAFGQHPRGRRFVFNEQDAHSAPRHSIEPSTFPPAGGTRDRP